MKKSLITIYTDGACSKSGNGGYAFVVEENSVFTKRYNRPDKNTTNQRTEVKAVISAFKYLLSFDPIPETTIITDSMYVVGTTCNNWKISSNKDLWSYYFKLYEKLKDYVTFKHVRGHRGIEGNELADMYAVIASNYANQNG